MSRVYLFVLSPPFSGSTVLWQLLQTSPHVSAFSAEGQHLPAVRDIMRPDRWNPQRAMPWDVIRPLWEAQWDLNQPVLLEKSPPHLLRAPAIDAAFPNAHFIVLQRDPYAFCEGYSRRTGKSMTEAAEFWLLCADFQRANRATLPRVLALTYEELTTDPVGVAGAIGRFVPQLGTLDPHAAFKAHSVLGTGARRLRNLNPIKIDRLDNAALAAVTAVLATRPDLPEAFGYALRRPSALHAVRHGWSRLAFALRRR